jgi:hypothetical protein
MLEVLIRENGTFVLVFWEDILQAKLSITDKSEGLIAIKQLFALINCPIIKGECFKEVHHDCRREIEDVE